MSTIDELKRLQSLLNEGAISKDEFEMLKKNVVSETTPESSELENDIVNRTSEINKSNEIEESYSSEIDSNKIEVFTSNCTSCGAPLEDFKGKEEVSCEFCNNTTVILRPTKVKVSRKNLEKTEITKFDNLVAIMEKSMIAGNFSEAYSYCNKALEIDPDSSSLWENKAIASFWIRRDSQIISSEAREILTYLNASKQANPDSPTYDDTARAIASNLFYAVYYNYLLKDYDDTTNNKELNAWSENSVRDFINYLNVMELCFDISPKTLYLDTAIRELTGLEKVIWIKVSNKGLKNETWLAPYNFDAVKSRERLLKKLTKFDADYKAPEFEKNGFCFIATAALGDYNHPDVIELRGFRDNWILTKNWGDKFVNWYYHYGAIAAKFIQNNYILKRLTYFLIVKPLVVFYRVVKN